MSIEDYKLELSWALVKDNVVLNTAVFEMSEPEIQKFAQSLGADFAIHCLPHKHNPSAGSTWDGEKFTPPVIEESTPPEE
jgi:hypothetical protein